MQNLIIDEFTYPIAQDAIRDILYMYLNLSSYNGFGCDIETGRFNQYLCIDAAIKEEGYFSPNELKLLHQGSAVKILCLLSDYDELPAPNSWLAIRLRELLIRGKLNHLTEVKVAIELALLGKHDEFSNQIHSIYRKYVIEHWVELVAP